MKAAVVYSRLPVEAIADGDDRYEEFDRPEVAAAVGAALGRHGIRACILEDGEGLVDGLRGERPDFVFNLAEGRHGRCREAIVPAICEHLDLPYTGSDAFTLAATLDKGIARRLVQPLLAVPRGAVVGPGDPLPDVPFPTFLKPLHEGSSKGVREETCLARDRDELARRIEALHRRYEQPVLVEEFVAGDEVTVAVLGNDPPEAAAMMQILPRRGDPRLFVYTLEAKRDWKRRIRYAVPPELPASTLKALEEGALLAFRALGCRDVARIDFRVTPGGAPLFLEANPLPGLCPEKGDIVLATRGAGISYEALIGRIAARAAGRRSLEGRPHP